SLPQPILRALPSAKVSLNGSVTLTCLLPGAQSLGRDTGSFRCIYYEKTAQPKASEPSEALNVCVTDYQSRPSLTVEPSSSVSLGEKVTFWCQAASCGIRFTLHKDGEDMPVDTINSTQGMAGFLIPHVTSKHSGSYSCLHHPGEDILTPAWLSEPLELSVY
ncbi:immunoglobulin superfamily member 1-like, partial [Gracilinanus agilis]|uniref:immunoglobulin superfamily member 1-like n=1 Tax=Gracilinanus agilis TaxID=191870 RepID=UPI001CFD719F